MFQKSLLFIAFSSLERQLSMLALPTKAATETFSGKLGPLEILKSFQDIPGHHMNILCTFNLNCMSTEIANWLKFMQNPQKLLVNEFASNKSTKILVWTSSWV